MKFQHLCHSLWATNHPPSPWQKAVQSGEGRLDFPCICACATGEEYSSCFPYLLQAASVNNETFVMQVFGQSKSKPWVTTCYKHSFAANLQNKTEQNKTHWSWVFEISDLRCTEQNHVLGQNQSVPHTPCQILPPSASWRQDMKVSYWVHSGMNYSYMFKTGRSPLFCAIQPVGHGKDSLTEERVRDNLTDCSLIFLSLANKPSSAGFQKLSRSKWV